MPRTTTIPAEKTWQLLALLTFAHLGEFGTQTKLVEYALQKGVPVVQSRKRLVSGPLWHLF